jgi:hypothetical protein
MSVVPVLVVVLLLVLLVGLLMLVLLMLVLTTGFLRAGGRGRTSTGLPSTVLPSILLLGAGEGGLSPTEVVVTVSAAALDLGEGFFFLDLLLVLWLDVALVTFGIESVVGVEEGGVRQGDVLAGSTVGDLLSIEISAETDSLVAVGLINEDDDLFSVESDVVLGGQDLDSTGWMGLDAGDVVVALLTLSLLADGEGEGDSLAVDDSGDVVGGLDLGEGSTGNAALAGELDLGLGEDELELHVVGSDVLGEDGHGVFSGAVGGQQVVAAFSGRGVDFSDDVVEAGDGLSLQLTGWLRIISEERVLDVLLHGLKGREWEGGLDGITAWDVIDLEFSLVGEEAGGPEFTIGSDLQVDDGRVSGGWGLWETVMVGVSHVSSLDEVTSFIDGLLESFWEVIGPLEGQAGTVKSGSLLNGNGQTVIGNGKSTLLFILFALLSFRGLGLGPFSHVLSTLELAGNADFVLLQVFVLASVGELSESLDLNVEFVVQERVPEGNQESWVGPLGVVDLGTDFRAEFGLLTGVVGLDDGVGELLNRVGVSWETAGGFFGGSTLSESEEEFVGTLGKLGNELLLVGVLSLEEVGQSTSAGFVDWLDFFLLGQHGDDDETSLAEDLSGVLVGVGSFVGLGRR